MDDDKYAAELEARQRALVRWQQHAMQAGEKVLIIFEGRDAAGKDGSIRALTEHMSVRATRVVALAKPSDRDRSQWYFQRYVPRLPAGGETVIFNRSWYNRAGVERVMGFCTEQEYEEFMRSCPEFEHMLVRSGIQLVKYWFSVSDDEQERRFQARAQDPMRRWKLSPMDLESRARWVEYSRSKDEMFRYTDIKHAPWWVVEADDKRRARLNCIAHLLSLVDSKKEQAKRLEERRTDPLKVLKASPMDAAAQQKWDAYSAARDEMLKRSSTERAPWYCVRADHKKKAHLALLSHIVRSLAPSKIAREVDAPDPDVLFPFELAALTDGRLER
jgi:polyphosphate kinase 2